MGLSNRLSSIFKARDKTSKKDKDLHKDPHKKSQKKPHKMEPIPAETDRLTLEIDSSHVRLYSQRPPVISNDAAADAAMTLGTDSPNTPSTQLLSGFITDFLQYSRQEASKWRLDIAHDICDPVARRGSLVVHRGQQWFSVANTDPLTASVYRYILDVGVTIGLAKISLRIGKSETSTTGNATTMVNHVRERDGRCWVSQLFGPLANSHICPKRMGDHMARVIFQTYTGRCVPNLSIFDPIFGFNLTKNLDDFFDVYKLGLHFVSPVRSSYLFLCKFY